MALGDVLDLLAGGRIAVLLLPLVVAAAVLREHRRGRWVVALTAGALVVGALASFVGALGGELASSFLRMLASCLVAGMAVALLRRL